MSEDFYCDEVLSTDNVLAFHHTRPFYPVHVVVIPKRHIPSLVACGEAENAILLELLGVVKTVAAQIVAQHGACRVVTNLGNYQDSKHLHWHVAFGRPLR